MRQARATRAAQLAALLWAAAGCRGRELGEVEGTVTLDGAPLPDVEVVFVPDPARGNAGNNATALTDARGHYRLRSPKEGRDGAAVGAHRVVVTDLRMVADVTGTPRARR